jgi:NAD-dependent SIR2 family protein deacetylase
MSSGSEQQEADMAASKCTGCGTKVDDQDLLEDAEGNLYDVCPSCAPGDN